MFPILTFAAKLPAFTHPIIFNPMMRFHLHRIGFTTKWLFTWRDEHDHQLRLTSGYDMAVDGCYRQDELYLLGTHRRFMDGFTKGHYTFCVHKAALIISWDNPYNWYVKYQAYKAVTIGRLKQDMKRTSSWKHSLNGLLWGCLLTMGVLL